MAIREQHVSVKCERSDDTCTAPVRSMTERFADMTWEQRFHRLAALAFSHGLSAIEIAEIQETRLAGGELTLGSPLWLGRRCTIVSRAGLGCVKFVGKTAFNEFLYCRSAGLSQLCLCCGGGRRTDR